MRTVLPYLLVAPLLIWIVVTVFIPVVNVLIESMYNTTYVGTNGKFVGLKNYLSVLKDKNYWTAWLKSLQWLVGCTLIQTVLGFGTALVLNGNGRIRSIARTWTVIPWIIPTIVVSIMWQWIFNSSYGILNNALMKTGLISSPINFFSGSRAMWTLICYITLPGLSHITFALGVIGTLWCFNIFDIIYITTEGGPLNLTTTVPVFIYREAFKNYKIGRSSAASIITAAFLLIIAILLAKATKPSDDT